jgi:L,D-transpeptidase catalytic domain
VVQVAAGDSLLLIADRFDDETVTAASIAVENSLPDQDTIQPDQLLDVCVDNGVNDITGEAITERNSVLLSLDVQEQQNKLNELFAGLGIRDLLVDGISGPVTRQRLCAARLGLGLPVSTADMVPGSDEEIWMMAAPSLAVPWTSATLSERWVLIDQTCQIMFVGAGTGELAFVFPTSTGEAGHETRPQDRSPVTRFNPALDNGGWHNSSVYPVAEDNPLNGNMYKPLYFDRGQAIHGANNVPTSPQSKGCARLRVEDQDKLLGWLGLGGPTSSSRAINLTVNVQGAYNPTPAPPPPAAPEPAPPG